MSTKILQRPQECINAHCGAMCSPIDAEFCDCNPKKCFKYERRDDLYLPKHLTLDELKTMKKEIEEALNTECAELGKNYQIETPNVKSYIAAMLNELNEMHEGINYVIDKYIEKAEVR